MSQVFPKSANAWSKGSIIAIVALVVSARADRDGVATLGFRHLRRNRFVEQPVQFSHQHHDGGIGIDCRYCHTSVEVSPSAGIPPTKTCINCHSQIWNTSPYLEPVRASFRDDKPLDWTRVHDLPDFVYFNHSIHVRKGVGCETCHGRVDHMPLMMQKPRCRWNGVSIATAIRRDTCGRAIRLRRWVMCRRRRSPSSARAGEGIQDRGQGAPHELLRLPPIK